MPDLNLPSSRRQFLKTTAAALGGAALSAPTLIPWRVIGAPGQPGANARFVVAHIGVGGMGGTHLNNMLRFQQDGKVKIAAVCDVDDNRLEAAWTNAGAGVTPYRDYRYILERKDIDAVLIATPDHWHAVQTVHACQTGKHVYVEKPASVTMREGQAMVAAARANKVAVQVGAQARTAKGAWYTCRAIRNGIVGKVSKVTCWHYANPVDDNPVPDSAPPEGLDWDLWLGPLPWRPYNRRYQPGSFRWILESGGGQIRDRGAHQFSTILWCMNADKQTSFTVEAKGTVADQGPVGLPDRHGGGLSVQESGLDARLGPAGRQGGQDGIRQRLLGRERPSRSRMGGRLPPGQSRGHQLQAAARRPGSLSHRRIRGLQHEPQGRLVQEPSAKGTSGPRWTSRSRHRTATLCNLGNLSMILGRKLVWDGEKQEVVGDDEANRLLGKPQRYPYCL